MEEHLNVAVNKLYRFSSPPSLCKQPGLPSHTANRCLNSDIWLSSYASLLAYSQLNISALHILKLSTIQNRRSFCVNVSVRTKIKVSGFRTIRVLQKHFRGN